MPTQKTIDRFNKVNELISKGSSLVNALKEVKMSSNTWYALKAGPAKTTTPSGSPVVTKRKLKKAKSRTTTGSVRSAFNTDAMSIINDVMATNLSKARKQQIVNKFLF